MKTFVYMMLVASVIGTDMPAVGQMKADGTMAEGRGEGCGGSGQMGCENGGEMLPEGMFPCERNGSCAVAAF